MTLAQTLTRLRQECNLNSWRFEGSEQQVLAKLLSSKNDKIFDTYENWKMQKRGSRIYVYNPSSSERSELIAVNGVSMLLIETEEYRETIIEILSRYQEIKMVARKEK